MEVMEQLEVQVPVPEQLDGSTSQNLQSWFIGKRFGIPAGKGQRIRDRVSEDLQEHVRTGPQSYSVTAPHPTLELHLRRRGLICSGW